MKKAQKQSPIPTYIPQASYNVIAYNYIVWNVGMGIDNYSSILNVLFLWFFHSYMLVIFTLLHDFYWGFTL